MVMYILWFKCWGISLKDVKEKSIQKKDGGLTAFMCFTSTVPAHLSGPAASCRHTGTDEAFQALCLQWTSNKASALPPTPVMLWQLLATVTKITKQSKPAPALSENSCNGSTNIYIFSPLKAMKCGLYEWLQCYIIPQSARTHYKA